MHSKQSLYLHLLGNEIQNILSFVESTRHPDVVITLV